MEKSYINQEIIDKIEGEINSVIQPIKAHHNRNYFFPTIINKCGFKIGAEIGVDKGDFSKILLKDTSLETLCCIDTWMDDFGSDIRPGYFDKSGERRMEEAGKNLSEFGGRVNLIRKSSLAASYDIPDNSLDFCYIDGDHSLEGIYTDIYSWIKKVRVGGILSGHDYKEGPGSGIKDYFGRQLPYFVKPVVNNFCSQYGFKLNAAGIVDGSRNQLVPSWWFVKNY